MKESKTVKQDGWFTIWRKDLNDKLKTTRVYVPAKEEDDGFDSTGKNEEKSSGHN